MEPGWSTRHRRVGTMWPKSSAKAASDDGSVKGTPARFGIDMVDEPANADVTQERREGSYPASSPWAMGQGGQTLPQSGTEKRIVNVGCPESSWAKLLHENVGRIVKSWSSAHARQAAFKSRFEYAR